MRSRAIVFVALVLALVPFGGSFPHASSRCCHGKKAKVRHVQTPAAPETPLEGIEREAF
ncbi:hypothetical protein HY251_18500 [bacterium]|nr:hypothetical protein [bacterium]